MDDLYSLAPLKKRMSDKRIPEREIYNNIQSIFSKIKLLNVNFKFLTGHIKILMIYLQTLQVVDINRCKPAKMSGVFYATDSQITNCKQHTIICESVAIKGRCDCAR